MEQQREAASAHAAGGSAGPPAAPSSGSLQAPQAHGGTGGSGPAQLAPPGPQVQPGKQGASGKQGSEEQLACLVNSLCIAVQKRQSLTISMNSLAMQLVEMIGLGKAGRTIRLPFEGKGTWHARLGPASTSAISSLEFSCQGQVGLTQR